MGLPCQSGPQLYLERDAPPADYRSTDSLAGLFFLARRPASVGPARYLTLKRLTTVIDALRQSDPNSATVTDTAIRPGFWELGRFAKDYRRTFGENPSDTLSKGTRRRG
jgi:transcriptional regulator GlxA family with amidase domain